MNISQLSIIFCLIWTSTFLFEVWLKYLNFKNIQLYKEKPPRLFEGKVEPEKYQKTIRYTLVNSRFSLITESINVFLFILVVLFGVFNYLDIFVRSFGLNNIFSGMIFFVTLILILTLKGIPEDLYSTFVIEEKFGFNTQTLKSWAIDFIKSLLVNLPLMMIITGVVLLFMEKAGDLWWIITWAFLFIFSVVMQILYPTLIAPIFNKFEVLPEGSLREKIEALAKKADFKIKNIFTMDASKRSKHTNAYFTGLGKNKRIVLFDTLINNHTEEEVIAVLAHEIGHYKFKHILKGMIWGQVFAFINLYIFSLTIHNPKLFDIFNIKQQSIYLALLIFGSIVAVLMFWSSPFLNYYSRKHEFEADKYAYDLLRNKEVFRSLFIRLSLDNLSNLSPHKLFVRFYYSHPPVIDRVGHIDKLE